MNSKSPMPIVNLSTKVFLERSFLTAKESKSYARASQRCWQQEDNFAREPVRHIIIARNTNPALINAAGIIS